MRRNRKSLFRRIFVFTFFRAGALRPSGTITVEETPMFSGRSVISLKMRREGRPQSATMEAFCKTAARERRGGLADGLAGFHQHL